MSEVAKVSGAVKVDGAILRYLIEGSGNPLLIIGSAVYYPRTFSKQLRKEFRLVFIDVRHFARCDASFALDTISLDTYIDDIEKVRTKIGLDRAIVVGHSHHGNLALEYAKRYPARVSHVVLIGSPPLEVSKTIQAARWYWDGHASESRKVALRSSLAALGSETTERMAPEDAYVAQYVAEGAKYWYDVTYDASFLWQEVPVNMGIMKEFRNFFGKGYELGWDPWHFSVPVLVVMGRHDYVVPHILWDEVRPRLPNITIYLFEHSGHTPQMEQQEKFEQVLLEWVKPESTARTI
jgi:proline iminopeptidase